MPDHSLAAAPATAGAPAPAVGAAHALVPAGLAVVLVLAVLARFGATPEGALAGAVTAVLVALSAIDLRERRLPNRIVLPAAAATLAAQALLFERGVECAVAAVAVALALALPLVFDRRAIGLGDVKLGLLLGGALGSDAVAALAVTGVAVTPVAVYLLLRHGSAARRATIPLGPFLAVGTIATMLIVGSTT